MSREEKKEVFTISQRKNIDKSGTAERAEHRQEEQARQPLRAVDDAVSMTNNSDNLFIEMVFAIETRTIMLLIVI